MRRSYVVCPWCRPPREYALQGITMHVKAAHPEHAKDYDYDKLRKTAVRREIVTKKKPVLVPVRKPPVREAPPRKEEGRVLVNSFALRKEEPVKTPGGEAPQVGQGEGRSPSSTDSTTPEFVDEEFNIIPEFVELPDRAAFEGEAGAEGEGIPGMPVPAPGPGPGPAAAEVFTEDDGLFLSEALWSLPGIIFDRIPEPDPVKLRKWNGVFYRYCLKKGINPFEILFDELPLVIATAGLAAPMWKAYKASTPSEEKKPEKGAEDYEHEKKVAEEKERALAEGRIRESPPRAVPHPLGAGTPEASGLGAPV